MLSRLDRFLSGLNLRAYVVGGFVRDVLLGRDSGDIDVALAGDAMQAGQAVANAFNGRYVLLDEANGGCLAVLTSEPPHSAGHYWQFDFSTLQGNIQEDLTRRDFTVNAMAIELGELAAGKELLIDPFHGKEDLEQRLLRAVSDGIFVADSVRLLRAVRLVAELGFTIAGNTETLMRHDARLISHAAGERVREELVRLLAVHGAGKLLAYMDELGLLTALIPELESARGAEQPKEHFWDVLDHSMKTVAAAEFLLREAGWEYVGEETLAIVPWSSKLADYFEAEVGYGTTRGSLLKLAALLHDIAKPMTRTIEENGRMRFFGHGKEGAEMTSLIMERLRFSNKEIRLVETMVAHHLRPLQMRQDGMPTRRAIYRFFRDTGEAGVSTLFLSLADHLAARGPTLDIPQWQEHARLVEYVLQQYYEQEGVAKPPKLIDGHDLINILGLTPGPKLGELLEAVREAQASGEVTNREEAFSFVRQQLSK